MLITDSKLNVKNFKEFFPELSWERVPRNLTQDHQDYFYVGTFEDDEKSIKASIRPSMRMQVIESYKNRTLEGKVPSEGYRGKLCSFGASAEVLVDPSFLEKVKEVAIDKPKLESQTISWE